MGVAQAQCGVLLLQSQPLPGSVYLYIWPISLLWRGKEMQCWEAEPFFLLLAIWMLSTPQREKDKKKGGGG